MLIIANRYEHFDFHQAVKMYNYENTNVLIHKLRKLNNTFNFFGHDTLTKKELIK
jgi:hypothetical protein